MKNRVKLLYAFFALISTCFMQAKDHYVQAKEVASRGFQTPKFDTNFPSTQLFSIADIGPKTYSINYSASLKMTRSAEYKPMNEAKGSPMFHVKASTVIVDLNGTTMYKSPTDSFANPTENCVGIEVGYSPRELAADSNLKQPHDVVIRNGILSDFDIAIVVHTGVKNVTFENITIFNSVIGCVCLGLDAAVSGGRGKVASCSFKNVKVVGENRPGRTVLVGGQAPLDWSKAKFENSDSTGLNGSALGFGYGTDAFMPLAHNTVADDATAYIYSGFVLDTVENILLSDIFVSHLGFDGDAGGSTAEASVTQGIVVRNSSSVFGEGIQSVNNVSALGATDLYLKSVVSSSFKHGVFGDSSVTEQEAATSTTGLSCYGVHAIDSIAITLDDLTCNRHVAPDNAYALHVQDGHVFTVSNVSADYNDAAFVHGLNFNNVQTISLSGCSSSYNNSTDATKFSSGMNFESCAVVSLDDCNIRYNVGGDLSGLRIVSGDSFHVKNIVIDCNSGSGKVVGLYGDTDLHTFDVRGARINSNSSTGNTVIGLHMKNAQAVTMRDISCNYNSSSGSGGDVTGVLFEAVTANDFGVQSLQMSGVEINNNSSTVSAAVVKPMIIQNGDSVIFDNMTVNGNNGLGDVTGIDLVTKVNNCHFGRVTVNGNSSTVGSVKGMYFDDASNVQFQNVSVSGNSTTDGTADVYGLEFAAAATVGMRDVKINNNVSFGGDLYGISVDAGKAVSIDGMHCNYNQSSSTSSSYGLKATTSLSGSEILNASFNNNIGGQLSYGIDIENSSSLVCKRVSAVSNQASDYARGMYLHNGEIVVCEFSDFSGNNVTATDIASENVLQIADISKHGGAHFTTGAYGVYLEDINGVEFLGVESSRNSGLRSAGILAKNIQESSFHKCVTSYQSATGNFFIDNAFDAVNIEQVAVPDAQASTIFGGVATGSVVDFKFAVQSAFSAVTHLKDLQDTGSLDPACVKQYGYAKNLSSIQLLTRAVIAQFRRYGTAMGIHLHDCTNCLLQDHTAAGNRSAKDSAVGCVTTGSSIGHIIHSGNFSGNEGWTDSKKQNDVDETIDITEILPLWTKLGLEILTVDGADTTTPITATVVKADLDKLPATMETPYVHKGRLVVSFTHDLAPFYELVHLTGGMGAGIVIGDAAENIEIKKCVCANNHGGAGQAFGLLQDVTTSCTVHDNQLYQTNVNTLGYGYGLAEFSFQSNSVHAGNILFGNAIDRMLNSNFFVPYDPDYPMQLSFQVKTIHNGDFSVMANALPYDNIEIEFIGKRSADLYLPDNVKDDWDALYVS